MSALSISRRRTAIGLSATAALVSFAAPAVAAEADAPLRALAEVRRQAGEAVLTASELWGYASRGKEDPTIEAAIAAAGASLDAVLFRIAAEPAEGIFGIALEAMIVSSPTSITVSSGY